MTRTDFHLGQLLLRTAFWLALTAAIGTSLACGTATTNTVARYQIRQNAWLADPAPRAVGELAPRGRLVLEGGYDRTFATTGPATTAGGNGQSNSVDTAHVRIARLVGRSIELGGFAQVGLSNQVSAKDIQSRVTDVGPVWLGLSMRGKPAIGDRIAFIGALEAAVGRVPWVRDIHIDQTATTTWASGSATTSTTSTDERDRGSSITARVTIGGHGELTILPALTLQVGAFGGLLPRAGGILLAGSHCAGTQWSAADNCTGSTPDDTSVLSYAAFFMPTAALTVTLAPMQLVLGGWWLAASTSQLEASTPAGMTLAVRAML